jgi:hypothetical protein
VIVLEYMRQIDDMMMNTHHNNPLTYMYSAEARNPTCSTCTKMPPDSEYRIATDIFNVVIHGG